MMDPRRWMMVLTLVTAGLLATESVGRAALDICGCSGSPKSLGAFDTIQGTGFPAGTTNAFRQITIPVPNDGILVFDSMNLASRPSDGCGSGACLLVTFSENHANTPVTLLVSGDVTMNGVTLSIAGAGGTGGSNGGAGIGGLGGPGGFRGGDGAYQALGGPPDGGAGLGPTGGAPALAATSSRGGDGAFFGVQQLLPLVGGAGGGGGASLTNALNCAGGGGGGGGGALLIAANGTIDVSGAILADGGAAGTGSSSCGTTAGSGSGGAVRLVANAIIGSGQIFARGGGIPFIAGSSGKAGIIRLEAFNNTLPPGNTDPPASRTTVPGPIVNALSPTVAITTVAGLVVPTPTTGNSGGVDVVLPAPGPAEIDLATAGVPSGTIVEVVVKPRVGSGVVTLTTTLSNCDTAGNCIAAVRPTLAAGAYVIEARATFQSQ